MISKANLWSKHKLWIVVSIFVVISLSINIYTCSAYDYDEEGTAHYDNSVWNEMEDSIRFNADGSWFNRTDLAPHPSMSNNIFTLPTLNQTENYSRTFGLVANEPVYVYLTAPEGDLDLYLKYNNQILALSTNDARSDEWIAGFLPEQDGNYTIMVYHDERDSSDQLADGTLYIHQNLVYAGCYFNAYFEGKEGGVGAEREYTRMYFRVDSDFESIDVIAPDSLDFYQINVYRREDTSSLVNPAFRSVYEGSINILEWSFGNADYSNLDKSDDAQGFGKNMWVGSGSAGNIVEIIAETGQGIAMIKINHYNYLDWPSQSTESNSEEQEGDPENLGNIPGYFIFPFTSVIGIILILFNHKRKIFHKNPPINS